MPDNMNLFSDECFYPLEEDGCCAALCLMSQ